MTYVFSGLVQIKGGDSSNILPFVARADNPTLSLATGGDPNDCANPHYLPVEMSASAAVSTATSNGASWRCTISVGSMFNSAVETDVNPILLGVKIRNISTAPRTVNLIGAMSAFRYANQLTDWDPGRV